MMEVLEALETCRAIRYLRPDPVPEELLRKLVYGATRASSPGNSQGWDFVLLCDRAKKEKIAEAIRAGSWNPPDVEGAEPVMRRMVRGAMHLIDHFADAPAIVFVCGRVAYPPDAPLKRFVWSTVYPAAQNLIVTARALGLGTTFTTLHEFAEPTIRETLAIPDDVLLGVTIPVGFPDRPFGPVSRKPVDDVLHWDGW
jgi:nitroreductase